MLLSPGAAEAADCYLWLPLFWSQRLPEECSLPRSAGENRCSAMSWCTEKKKEEIIKDNYLNRTPHWPNNICLLFERWRFVYQFAVTRTDLLSSCLSRINLEFTNNSGKSRKMYHVTVKEVMLLVDLYLLVTSGCACCPLPPPESQQTNSKVRVGTVKIAASQTTASRRRKTTCDVR